MPFNKKLEISFLMFHLQLKSTNIDISIFLMKEFDDNKEFVCVYRLCAHIICVCIDFSHLT